MGDGVTQLCMDRRLYQRELSKSERAKQDKFLSAVSSVVAVPVSSPSTTNGDTLEISQDNNESNPISNIVNPTSTGSDMDRSVYLDTILEQLTPDDVRVLIRSEDELAQATHFSRIFPTQVTYTRKYVPR
jgi:hypothetical protein